MPVDGYKIDPKLTPEQNELVRRLYKDSMYARYRTPSSATDTGNKGDFCWDTSYIYICTAHNVWKRVGISTW